MPDKPESAEFDRMTQEIFELIKLASTARARARAGKSEDLSEAEFLTLDALTQHDSLNVGDIQKHVGVLPAQMSRIIRTLESKQPAAFVECNINPDDRRKIDVRVTRKGVEAYRAYRAARLQFAADVLRSLSFDERMTLMGTLSKIRDGLARRLRGAGSADG